MNKNESQMTPSLQQICQKLTKMVINNLAAIFEMTLFESKIVSQ